MWLNVALCHLHQGGDVTGSTALLDFPTLNPHQHTWGDVFGCGLAAFRDACYKGRLRLTVNLWCVVQVFHQCHAVSLNF